MSVHLKKYFITGLLIWVPLGITLWVLHLLGSTMDQNTRNGPAPSVRAEDQYGNAVPGTAVSFAVALGAGSLTGEQQTTNAQGIATLGSWTLGTQAGQQLVRASATVSASGQRRLGSIGIAIGADSHCPIDSPSESRPRKSSGSRQNSAVKRSTP